MTPALLAKDLTVSLHGRTLVHGINLRLEPGERLALLGASGSGKSLTAAALLGQLPSEMTAKGELQIHGQSTPLNRRRPGHGNLAAIQQDPMTALNPMVRLGLQIGIPLRDSGLSAKDAHQRAIALLNSVGIEDPERAANSFSGELSGGQLQRVCIALALACRSSILIADECTTALDVISQAKVLEVLTRKNKNKPAILFITHDIAAAAALCTRAMVLHHGRIVEEASMADVLAHPHHAYTQRLVEAAREGFGSLHRRGGCDVVALPSAKAGAA